MPEYLAPGVYIEETSYRAKSIEGVATSTTGFVGPTRWGPTTGPARLVTSFEEFASLYGGLDDLAFSAENNTAQSPSTNYLAHAARAYFENGGRRLYVARVATNAAHAKSDPIHGITFEARYPGELGSGLTISVSGTRGPVALVERATAGATTWEVSGLSEGELVEVLVPTSTGPKSLPDQLGQRKPDVNGVYKVSRVEGRLTLTPMADPPPETALVLTERTRVYRLSISISVQDSDSVQDSKRKDTYMVGSDPATLLTLFNKDNLPDSRCRIQLTADRINDPAKVIFELLKGDIELKDGSDGDRPAAADLSGDPAQTGLNATGLKALEEIDDIAIVAAPGCGGLTQATERQSLREALLSHCKNLRYRFAILSAGKDEQETDQIRAVRSRHDSDYGALYHPWVQVTNPLTRTSTALTLPPEGFIAGIYARSDIERGVHKAPANEVVRGALEFSVPISHGTQEVLNPEGINCMRFFEGRGNRVWGARTLSSDPEWKYVNVRRLFIYLEHSIDRAIQWAVFEPNNEALWKKVTMTIESFLVDTWRTGALMGLSPKEAFFVRCDRTTMTQGDLDNGRLVCLIGVAPTKPAEFVIFRIGQWTADASTL